MASLFIVQHAGTRRAPRCASTDYVGGENFIGPNQDNGIGMAGPDDGIEHLTTGGHDQIVIKTLRGNGAHPLKRPAGDCTAATACAALVEQASRPQTGDQFHEDQSTQLC